LKITVEGPPVRRWWRRPWLAPLAIVVVAFIAFSVPPYLTFDPSRSRVPQPEGFAAHYPLLVAHVVFGSVAMVTCCFQIWPWFRRRYQAAHRVIGRVYVFGGVIPGGIMGLTIGAVSPFGPTIRVSNVLLATLWLAFTITGLRMARQRRLVEHRRWMIRSFALTVSIITNRLWAVIVTIVLMPQLATTFGGRETLMVQTIAGLSGWLGWVTTLLVAEWWLERSLEPITRTAARSSDQPQSRAEQAPARQAAQPSRAAMTS
jgi:uncharacterized membrane protein YozB (DUF420 family)